MKFRLTPAHQIRLAENDEMILIGTAEGEKPFFFQNVGGALRFRHVP